MTERNPWTETYWNITAQGKFLLDHGIEKAREAAAEAGLDPDQVPGLREEALIPQGVDAHSLLAVFTKENAEKFEQTVKAYKPPPPPRAGLDYSGYMRKKRAGKLPGQS
jgi:hypothetical protein